MSEFNSKSRVADLETLLELTQLLEMDIFVHESHIGEVFVDSNKLLIFVLDNNPIVEFVAEFLTVVSKGVLTY